MTILSGCRVKQGQTLTLTSRARCFYDFELFCWYHVLHLPFLWVPSFPHIYLLMAKWIITYVFLLTSPFHYGWQHFEQLSMEYWKKSRIALFQLYCTLWLFPKNLCHSLDQLYAKLKPIRFISHIFLRLQQFGWFYFEFSLALKGIFLSSDWLLWLHWF